METLQLTFTFKAGSSNKDLARALRHHAGLLEGLDPKEASSRKNTENEDSDEGRGSKSKTTPKKAAPEVIEEDFLSTEESFDGMDETLTEEEAEEPPKKAPTKANGKAKITVEMVNDACKAFAEEHGVKKTKERLMVKFKTDSISKLKQEQWPLVIQAMTI